MLEQIINGGPLMIMLLICSMAALAVFIDRFQAFRSYSRVDSRSLRANVFRHLEENRIEEAVKLCKTTPGPISAVLLTGLTTYERYRALNEPPESLRDMVGDAMQDYSLHAMGAVQQRLNVLATVGNAAPLIGMAGTVLGMITSFGAMSSAGQIDNTVVSAGIAEALITTAAGLLIALGAVIPYSWFMAKVDAIEREIQGTITETIDLVTILTRGSREKVTS